MKFNCKEDIIQITPLWKGERMEDGRPKVSSDVLRRLRKITLEEAWGPLWQKGYKYQFEGEFRTTHPGATLVGRAVTGVYVPMRPDLNDYLLIQQVTDHYCEPGAATQRAAQLDCKRSRNFC